MEETEWAIEECLKSGLPVSFINMLHQNHQNHYHHQNHYRCHDNDNHKDYIQVALGPIIIIMITVVTVFIQKVAATMCIGPEGDLHGNSAAECAIRMARAGHHHHHHRSHHHL